VVCRQRWLIPLSLSLSELPSFLPPLPKALVEEKDVFKEEAKPKKQEAAASKKKPKKNQS
jgi:hypothetical protein